MRTGAVDEVSAADPPYGALAALQVLVGRRHRALGKAAVDSLPTTPSAARQSSAATRWRSGQTRPRGEREEAEHPKRRLRTALGDTLYEAQRTAGTLLTPDQAEVAAIGRELARQGQRDAPWSRCAR